METNLIERAYLESRVTSRNGYPYCVNPITDGTPEMTKPLMDQITDGLLELSDFDCDVILAPEAMAIPYATAVTLRTGVPNQIIRKRRYGLPGEIEFSKSTGYAKSEMFLNNVPAGTEVIIIDDVVSTGGSLRAIVRNLADHGIRVKSAVMVLDKSEDIRALSEELGIPIRAILKVGVEDGKPVVYGRSDIV